MSPDVLRLSLSCTECRSRKVKCDRADPCGNCVARNVKCSKEVLRKPNRKRRASASGTGEAEAVAGTSVTSSPPELASAATISAASPQGSIHGEALSHQQPLMLSSPSFAATANLSSFPAHVTAHPSSSSSSSSPPGEFDVAAYDGLTDVLFSDDFLDSLIGASEKHAPSSNNHSHGHSTASDNVATRSTSATSASPASTHDLAAVIPLRNTLCVLGFRHDASILSEQTMTEYRRCLPTPCSVERIISALNRQTTLLSWRHDGNTFLDVDAYTEMLHSHLVLFMQADAPGWATLTANDIFYIVCGLYLVAQTEKQDTTAVSALATKLSRQLAGCEATLKLLQSYRMLGAACLSDNDTEQAALAISSGSRAAVSMGIHRVASVANMPAREQPYLTEAVLTLLCDACIMQAVFGIRTPIDPANIEASLLELGETSFQASYLQSTSDAPPATTHESHSGSLRVAPVRLRMHATIWIFVERYYGSSVYMQLPTEERLQTIAPLRTAEPFELAQCKSLSAILRDSSLLVERPLLPWLSPLQRSKDNNKNNPTPTSQTEAVGLSKTIQMLFMIRYYHILVVYPFARLQADARSTLEETIRSIISSTWRMAKRCNADSLSNLDFCRRICLRALAFLVASTGSHSSCAEAEAYTPGIDHKERLVADLELGIDAIEKIDHILTDKPPLAALASQISMCGIGLAGHQKR